MVDKVTVATLHEMKRQRQRIVSAVCYEYQMAQIADRAGADVLSVGDSVGRVFLAYDDPDGMTLDEMIPFARAVNKAAERALVSCDMPTSAVNAGPRFAADAAKRIADETGVQMVKVDIREDMDGLFPVVEAVLKASVLAVYPQIGYSHLVREGNPAAREVIVSKAKTLESLGAAMLDLTGVTAELYKAASEAVRMPVIGGQSGPEADGHIYVTYPLVGYQSSLLDKAGDGPNAAQYIFDIQKKAFANVHAGTF